jgi:hypothetical protein
MNSFYNKFRECPFILIFKPSCHVLRGGRPILYVVYMSLSLTLNQNIDETF